MFRRRLVYIILMLVLIGLPSVTSDITYAAQRCVSHDGEDGCFASIQAAVDKARSGSTILIKEGTYTEQVTIIGKNLTLRGEKGAIVKAPANMAQTLLSSEEEPLVGDDLRGVIAVKNAKRVTIRSLTIDGASSGATNQGLVGILYVNAGGKIRQNTIQNVNFGSDLSPNFEGDGIDIFDTTFPRRTVWVTQNRIVNFNSNGITLIGDKNPDDPNDASLVAYVTKNTVMGSGVTDVIGQYGIQFGGFGDQRLIKGRVSENRISNVFATAGEFPAIGLAVGHPYKVRIDKNDVMNAQRGIDVYLSTRSLVTNNQVHGPEPNAVGYQGIGVSGTGNRVRENSLTNLEVGIRLYNNESDGVATDTRLSNNHFRGVTQKVVEEEPPSSTTSAQVTGQASSKIGRKR